MYRTSDLFKHLTWFSCLLAAMKAAHEPWQHTDSHVSASSCSVYMGVALSASSCRLACSKSPHPNRRGFGWMPHLQARNGGVPVGQLLLTAAQLLL
jgi:hypothetical protein